MQGKVSEQDKESRERLQKVLAQAGVASRRRAEELIVNGRVSVNGNTVSTLGIKVGSQDYIEVDGQPLKRSEVLHYYLLNKPVGVITSASDPRGRPTVVDLLKDVPVRVYPVGRLDYDTSGLLVLTNDGELAHRLMHPSYGVDKTYRVWLKGRLSAENLKNLRQGVLLEDGITAPAVVQRVSGGLKDGRVNSKGDPLEILEITIHEGRNRQIRRMFAALGCLVVKLERIKFGPLIRDNRLLPGKYRPLNRQEIKQLRSQVGLEG